MWAITTAGFDRTGICYEQRTYGTKILGKLVEDDSFFCIVYTLDKDDDWKDPAVWPKANPNWGISVKPDTIEKAAKKAMAMSSALNNFLTKHLNVWVNAESAWMNMLEWDGCKDEDMLLEQFKKDKTPCIIAADLASKRDFASYVKVFRKVIDGKPHYYAFARHYLNERAAEENSNDQIPGWIQDKYIIETEGSVTDLDQIEDDILDDASNFNVLEVAFDPREASQMMQHLAAKNLKVIEFTQNRSNMSEPTKETEALVFARRLHHDGDPVLAWMVSNAVAHTNEDDHVYLKRDYSQPDNKIDGCVATVMAIGRWMQERQEEKKYQVLVFRRRR